MGVAEREDGQRLLALNEIFVGHRTHQSARYVIEAAGRRERQSSSGLLCATGTGATGWARSICEQRQIARVLSGPEDPRLAWFVREPFPSVYTATTLDFGLLEPGERLVAHSEMAEGGVAFADGIESDALEFLGGQGHLPASRKARLSRSLSSVFSLRRRTVTLPMADRGAIVQPSSSSRK